MRCVLEMAHYFAGKFQVSVQTGADRRAAQRQFFERRDGALHPLPRIKNLSGVSAKFLAEPNRGRIH